MEHVLSRFALRSSRFRSADLDQHQGHLVELLAGQEADDTHLCREPLTGPSMEERRPYRRLIRVCPSGEEARENTRLNVTRARHPEARSTTLEDPGPAVCRAGPP